MRLFFIIFLFTFSFKVGTSGEVFWADTVLKCTSQKSRKQHSCTQLLGAPNAMPQGGSNPAAWGPKTRNDMAVLKVGYQKALKAKQIIVAENHFSGCIFRAFVINGQGHKKRIYTNKEDTVTVAKRIFSIPIPQTFGKVKKVELQIAGSYRNGWPQIDAIGLKSGKGQYVPQINTPEKEFDLANPEPLSKAVNSRYDELHPLITPEGDRLYFVRGNHPENKGGKDAGDAIWYLNRQQDGSWSDPKQLSKPLNNRKSNVITGVLPGDNRMLVRDAYSDKTAKRKSVALSERRTLGWGEPTPLSIENFYNRNESSSFFMANNGKTLVMALQRYKGEGGLDLYVSHKTGENQWSEPQHMGKGINTPADDITPYLASDNKTLYFSTKGFPTFGNHDIFMSRRKGESWTEWTEPVNLGNQINTKAWDGYFTMPASGAFSYYVSYKNTRNMADIFKAQMPVNLKPEPVIMVEGEVINDKTGEPIEAKVINEDLNINKRLAENYTAPKKGTFKSIVPEGQKAGLFAQSDDYIAKAETIETNNIDSFKKVKQNIRMIPIEVGQTIRLDNIFFEFNKATLKPTSHSELNRVAKLLEDNSNMKIKVAGHTDSVGGQEYNLKLSKNRAESVKEYLVNEKGTRATRIQTKGYGESKPVATNKTEEGRKKNRRVNFTILKK